MSNKENRRKTLRDGVGFSSLAYVFPTRDCKGMLIFRSVYKGRKHQLLKVKRSEFKTLNPFLSL